MTHQNDAAVLVLQAFAIVFELLNVRDCAPTFFKSADLRSLNNAYEARERSYGKHNLEASPDPRVWKPLSP
jgi:hypothetical protein